MRLFLSALIVLSSLAYAEGNVKMEAAANQKDLQLRVTELEASLQKLEARLNQLENKPAPAPVFVTSAEAARPVDPNANWYCKVRAVGSVYSAKDMSKEKAMEKAIKSCRSTRGAEGFLCRDPECAQEEKTN